MKITLQNLTKRFPSRNKKNPADVIAVNNFNIEIPDGKLIGLLGPSGCGKSTALNLLCGLQKPTEGRIFFGEEDVTELPAEKRGVGFVFQNYALYPHLTVMQNIIFPLENLKGAEKLTKQQMQKKALEAAKLVQIDELMERKPSELSGGQQQRVAIARALVKMPKILLMDEPLSNLDARLRLQTREEIRRIQRATKITTVFVTHDQEEAMSISDLIVVMKDGVIQQVGKPQEVYDNPINLFVAKFLGTPPINVFEGKIVDGWLRVGENELFAVKLMAEKKNGMSEKESDREASAVEKQFLKQKMDEVVSSNKEVYVCIRPEGFEAEPEGRLVCSLQGVEVMGRDITVISTHEASLNTAIRSIVDAETPIDEEADEVRFNIRESKIFLFDKETEERIEFEIID